MMDSALASHVPPATSIPWQARVSAVVAPEAFWAGLASAIFVIELLLVRFANAPGHGLPAFAVYCVMIGYAGYLPVLLAPQVERALTSAHRFVDLSRSDLDSWAANAASRVYNLRNEAIGFLLLSGTAVPALLSSTEMFQLDQPWFGTPVADIFALFAFVVWCAAMSHIPVFIFQLLGVTQSLGRLPIRSSFYHDPHASLYGLGRALLGISVHVLVLLSLAYFGLWLSPLPMTAAIWPFVVLAALCTAMLFMGPQYEIHRLMVAEKHNRISKLSVHLEAAMTQVLADPSHENIAVLDRLETVRQKVHGMAEWPFSIALVGQLVASIAVPILLMLADLYLRG